MDTNGGAASIQAMLNRYAHSGGNNNEEWGLGLALRIHDPVCGNKHRDSIVRIYHNLGIDLDNSHRDGFENGQDAG